MSIQIDVITGGAKGCEGPQRSLWKCVMGTRPSVGLSRRAPGEVAFELRCGTGSQSVVSRQQCARGTCQQGTFSGSTSARLDPELGSGAGPTVCFCLALWTILMDTQVWELLVSGTRRSALGRVGRWVGGPSTGLQRMNNRLPCGKATGEGPPKAI